MQKKQVIRGRLSFLDQRKLYECTFFDFLKSDLDHSTAAAIRAAICEAKFDRA